MRTSSKVQKRESADVGAGSPRPEVRRNGRTEGERQGARGVKQTTDKAVVRYLSILFLLITIILSGCTRQDSMFKESRVLMDTYCTITVVSPSKKNAGKAIEAGFAEIKKLETLLNYFSDNNFC